MNAAELTEILAKAVYEAEYAHRWEGLPEHERERRWEFADAGLRAVLMAILKVVA